jgi:signal transduction histidine kinase
VTLTEDLKQVVITVSDQGRGIPQNEIPYLFEKFHRVNVLTPDSEGLGIGLYMAHRIVTKHGGSIKVESQEGEGTTINVMLPKETGRTFFEGLG